MRRGYDEHFWPWLEKLCFDKNLNVVKVKLPNNPSDKETNYENWSKIFEEQTNGIDLKKSTIIAYSLGSIFSVKYIQSNNKSVHGYISLAGALKSRKILLNLSPRLRGFVPSHVACKHFSKLVENRHSFYSSTNCDDYFSTKRLEQFASNINAEHHPIQNVGHLRDREQFGDRLAEVLGRLTLIKPSIDEGKSALAPCIQMKEKSVSTTAPTRFR